MAAAVTAALMGGVTAASYDDIPDIEVYGQHFFYTNNGSQFFLKGVAYQQNYSPNGSTSTNATYTDPLADATGCARDIPYMKQIYTNIIRVYAIDPTKDHDECMAQLASADIYVIADLGEPGTSIESNDPVWDVTLYNRYISVIDSLQKYKNVLGFFAGNENVSSGNQTAAAAFVKAAVRDAKGYINSQGYRSTLGVGYATADVPTRDELAHYFACEPDSTNSTQIDFWGYNVYSWCGDSDYSTSSYGERVDFFSDYPVPAFFAEYGCIEGIDGGATHRPFTEVEVLYGNMTKVFSGGIVYEWFMGTNDYGLVDLTDSDASVSPYPDFTSLRSQLATVSPSSTARSAYTPANSAPACPSTGTSWAAVASPLPPSPNAQLCACMAASLQCNIKSTNAEAYADVFDYICAADSSYCDGFAHNATTGDYGGYSGCDPKDQLAWAANQYYIGNSKSASACDFSGLATRQTAATANSCTSLLSAVGTAGTGTAASPTVRGTSAGATGTATKTSSKAAAGSVSAPGFFEYGGVVFGVYALTAVGSLMGMLVL
ncbi:carbohydrate-binding module family 43 protein [Dothidotthia symphoricarpi CBS 119687]|uniref:1,3-beta-glucanosyltransferase n=1 Tax=Dothidotthia symphoricarpi CBS 119687 TaxID=1392245 RepID=A0A6A6ACX6_9PLEO|nr:carbohydrate-binding module family 43 protein [Dothidotthia symphoricarpi CBS 119687]KAF2129416.1 carbohydrate-binding module family 43 protein [Dothidotthia symphoricarpi CBS 119687]